MSPVPKEEDQQPLFARESLFRQRLNQLRSTGDFSKNTEHDGSTRLRELEKGNYLSTIEASLHNTDPKELEKLTLLDSLTELYNHSAINRILKDEIKRAKRYKSAVSTIALVVDDIQKIANEQGPLTFESILKGVANFLMHTVREVDIPGRYDFDHLLIICPETDAHGASILAERIRSKIEVERISEVGQNWYVTLSLGISSYPAQAQDEEHLVANALTALSDAKQSGGNTFRLTI